MTSPTRTSHAHGDAREDRNNTLEAFVDHLVSQSPESYAASLLWDNNQTRNHATQHSVLVQAAQYLFQRIEELGTTYRMHVLQDGKDTTTRAANTAFSGLSRLYVDEKDSYANILSVEMLWGQVQLQNESVCTALKSSIRKLDKAASTATAGGRRKKGTTGREIRLLYPENPGTNAPSPIEETQTQDDEKGDDISNDDDDDENDNDKYPTVESEGDDVSRDSKPESVGERVLQRQTKEISNDKDSSEDNDPAAEALNTDGFFDIHEMEAFADEEEDYLPTEDIPMLDANDPHDEDEDDDEDMSENDAPMSAEKPSKRTSNKGHIPPVDGGVARKKYRQDDEVNALLAMYRKPSSVDSDDDDIINMTAADLFGPPRKSKTRLNFAAVSRKESYNDDVYESDVAFEDDDDDEGLERKPSSAASKTLSKSKGSQISSARKDFESTKEGVANKAVRTIDKDHEKITGKDLGKDPIEKFEEELLSEKPWQMRGEVSSMARPTNSLLDSTPEFEFAVKRAPTITTAMTETLEETIKRRILAEDWDDVIPRELPDVGWMKQRGILPEVSQEKSKLGLGELYEREYLKKAAHYDVDAAEEESELQKAKNEMKMLFANLCSKLDALSNYHFAPRPIESDADIHPVTKPAISMEEVLPLHVSTARSTAPEEIYGKKHGRDGILRDDSELEQSERKRLRASKKAQRRKKRKQKEADEKLIARVQPGLGLNNPYEKRKALKELEVARSRGDVIAGKSDVNSFGKSGTVFKHLQEQAQNSLKRIASVGKEPEGSARPKATQASKASFFKL